ncbi:MAG: BolA/IbaG family iron-sulfur metabolism protein [Planctomycetes bacterium]|nr:BolA/IbaG family iron-sulfur metabolism protein [Planctomycetota bacterium]
MMTAEEIHSLVLDALPGAQIDVVDTVGDQNHWRVVVTSDRFDGLSLIEQHKLVMGSLSSVLGGRMHAVEIKTMLPE